jgi:hypothetical protein
MHGGAGCGFSLLKNAGPHPAPHRTKEKNRKIEKIMFFKILSIINRAFSLVYKANSIENVLVWK